MGEREEHTSFIGELKSLSDDDLFNLCKKVIALQIENAENEDSEWHWKCDFCFMECDARGKLSIYARAYESLRKGKGE